jgi:hypothetical protein
MMLKLIKQQTEIIASIDPSANKETCERCDAALRGSLILTSEIINGVGIIRFTEQNPRNWILCDGCNALLCQNCAPQWKGGYCDECVREYDLKFDSEGCLIGNSAEEDFKCRLCGVAETDGDCGSREVLCDACREEFDPSELCCSCYYKPYPLRLCSKCIEETKEV